MNIDTEGLPPELAAWWLNLALEDLRMALPKVEEYGGKEQGSADLHVMGETLATLLGWEGVPGSTAQELAVWFYVMGKIGRLVSDYRQRRPGKEDTWSDVRVYSFMAARLQKTGSWP